MSVDSNEDLVDEIFNTSEMDKIVAHQLYILTEYASKELNLHFFADDYYMLRLHIRSMFVGVLFSSKMTRAVYDDASRDNLLEISEEEADEALKMIEKNVG